MRENNKAFGESYLNDFKIGDLVYWNVFEQKEDYSIDIVVHRGALIRIVIESEIDGRDICYGVVLPYGQTTTRKVNITILKKITN